MRPPIPPPEELLRDEPDGVVVGGVETACFLAAASGIVILLSAILPLLGGGRALEKLVVAGALTGVGAGFLVPAVWPGRPRWALHVLRALSLSAGLIASLIGLASVGLLIPVGCGSLPASLVLFVIAGGAHDGLTNDRRRPHGFEVITDEPPQAEVGAAESYRSDSERSK